MPYQMHGFLNKSRSWWTIARNIWSAKSGDNKATAVIGQLTQQVLSLIHPTVTFQFRHDEQASVQDLCQPNEHYRSHFKRYCRRQGACSISQRSSGFYTSQSWCCRRCFSCRSYDGMSQGSVRSTTVVPHTRYNFPFAPFVYVCSHPRALTDPFQCSITQKSLCRTVHTCFLLNTLLRQGGLRLAPIKLLLKCLLASERRSI
jgi:hypothetical protein